jgi:DNA repair exonuclease SbcCD ATPase subunit
MKHKDLKHFIKESITDWLEERKIKDESVMSRNQDNDLFDSDPIKEEKPSIVDQIAEFYYVTNPTKESKVEELVRSGDIFEFAQSGLTREDIHGIFKSENKAKTAANRVIKERDLKIKETYKKGQDKLKTMESQIDEIKGQIEKNASEAVSNPDMRESLNSESDSLYEKLSKVEGMIERLREVLEKESLRFEKKSKKDDKKDDKKEEK